MPMHYSFKPFFVRWYVLGCLLMVGFQLSSCTPKTETTEPEPIRPVRTVVAKVGEGFMWRSYYGSVQADLISKLSFRVGGVVEEIAVELGQRVSKGQLIASINDNDLILQLDQEKAALLEAQAEALNAKLQYERTQGLVAKGVVSQKEYESSDTKNLTSKAALQRHRKGVELAKKRLTYANLSVPVQDCTVSDLEAEVGENVNAGQIIATLNCGDHFEVLTHVSENVIRDIYVGDRVTIRLNIYQGEEYQGIVSEVGAAVGNRSTFPVVIRITEPGDRLRVGMAAEVRLKVSMDQLDGFIVVPFSSVGEDSIGRFVYLYESDENSVPPGHVGVARRVSVEIGQVTDEGISLKSGVKEGDRVITAGLRYLTDGRKVKLFTYTGRG